jgi:hypothetical protein
MQRKLKILQTTHFTYVLRFWKQIKQENAEELLRYAYIFEVVNGFHSWNWKLQVSFVRLGA